MPEGTFRQAWWLPGAHAQTVGARLLRSRDGRSVLRRERLELGDGDFLDLDFADRDAAAPLVVVLHGLEGSTRSGYALELYRALARVGLQAVGVNFRSCSGELNRLPRLYHSGETGDLAFVLRLVRRRFPGRALAAAGFSLGGNVLLKYLGESGDTGLEAAVAISVPFDLAAGARRLERGFSRVYRRYLVGKLKRKTRAKAALLRGRVSLGDVRRARTFAEFDDAATAPLHGFANAQDYYARSSSARYLGGVRVPTLLIHSADDPFLPASAVPHAVVAANPALTAEFTDHGGHVGFVAGPPWAPVFWAERRAARFLADHLGMPRAARRRPGDEDDAGRQRQSPSITRRHGYIAITCTEEITMPTSSANATWNGKLKDGDGHFETASGSAKGEYTFATRFEGKKGTNPEELIAAAHAACFSMALAAGLEKAGTPATRISTKASCTLDMSGGGPKIAKMRLETRGVVSGIDQAAFLKAAEAAKNGCPVSGALKGNVAFELDAHLAT